MTYEEINKTIYDFEQSDLKSFLVRKQGKILNILAFYTDDTFKYRFLNDEIFDLVISDNVALINFCNIIRGLKVIPDFIRKNEKFRQIVGRNFTKIKFANLDDYSSCLWIYNAMLDYMEFDEIDKTDEYNMNVAKTDKFVALLFSMNTNLGNKLLQEDFIKDNYDYNKILELCIHFSYVPEMFKNDYLKHICNLKFSKLLWHFREACFLNRTDLGTDQTFTSLIANSFSEWRYRAIVQLLSAYIDVSLIEEKRKKYYLRKIKRGIGYNEIDDFIFNYVFEDFYINVIKNVREILRYNGDVNLLSDYNVKFYEKMVTFKYMSYFEKMEFFKFMMSNMKENINFYKEMLYDDIRFLKSHSYQEFMDKSIKIEESSHLYDSELSSQYGVGVYHLQGEEFNALVREYIINDNFSQDFEAGLLNQNSMAFSFSYIGNKHFGTFYNDNIKKKGRVLLLLHSHINKDNIVYVSKEDAYTAEGVFFAVSNKVNELHTIDSLLDETDDYNELYIKTDCVDGRSDAIVCFDDISDEVVLFAKKCNLPILLIDRFKYVSEPKKFKLEKDNHYTVVFNEYPEH